MIPNIKTNYFCIRPFESKDLKGFTQYRAIPTVAKYQSWSDYSYSDAVKLFENIDYSRFGSADEWFQLAIADNATDIIMGDLAIHFVGEQQIEIGFTIDPEFQNQGLASSALTLMLDYLFTKLDKHRVVAITDCKNIPSCCLLEKLKFRREAHYIKNIFFKGAWGDEYLYAMLKEEYMQYKKLNSKYTEVKK